MNYNVLRLRKGEAAKTYLAANDDPSERANLFRQACAEAKPGDELLLSEGVFDFGYQQGKLIFPTGVDINGAGKYKTHLRSSVHSDQQGTAFTLTHQSDVSNLTLECNTHAAYEDGRTVGYDPLPGQTTGFRSELTHCRIIGVTGWTVYTWNNLGGHIILRDCELKFGRQGVSAMGSGSSESQYVDIINCKFEGDGYMAEDVGATSDVNAGGVIAVCARGGRVRVINSEMLLKGRPKATHPSSFVPRVVGITDWFADGPSAATKIEVYNLKSRIYPNGSPVTGCFDLDIKNAEVKKNAVVLGGTGSGPNKEFTQGAVLAPGQNPWKPFH